MERLIKSENRIPSTFSGKAKTEMLFYYILSAVMFLVCGFFLFEFMYELCNIVGSVVSGTPAQAVVALMRMIPVWIVTAGSAHVAIYSFSLYSASNEDRRVKGWRVNGIIDVVLGAAAILYVVIGRFAGLYESMVEGNPTFLFPSDVLCAGIILGAIGIYGIFYSGDLKTKPSALPERKKEGIIFRLFFGFIYLLAMYGFFAAVNGLFIMDWSHGYVFFNIMVTLTYLCSVSVVAFYRFIALEANDGAKGKILLRYGLILLAVNAVVFILYLVAVQLQNEAPNLNAFGILPIEFTASFNAFPVIYAISNLLAPAVFAVKGLIAKIKEKKQ